MKDILKRKIRLVSMIAVYIGVLMLLKVQGNAAPLSNIPQTLTQPDGTEISCFASGDEYFNYLHDADGNIITENEDTGEYVYAKIEDGLVVSSETAVQPEETEDTGDVVVPDTPPLMGSDEDEKISIEDIPEDYIRSFYENSPLNQISEVQTRSLYRDAGKHKFLNKTVNNIVIFIEFANVKFSSRGASHYDAIMNTNVNSVSKWFEQASYGKTGIVSNIFTTGDGTMVATYCDSKKRSAYKGKAKKDSQGNTIQGEFEYYDENGQSIERMTLENQLLSNAINAVKNQIPESLNIDVDNDGNVDCIMFVIAGKAGGELWNNIIWPHRGYFVHNDTLINGKKAADYVLVTEEAMGTNASTIIHELFHLYGAPDLYHYADMGSSVGNWDMMNTSYYEPMTNVYMKYKYGGWIDEIKEIKTDGSYTINKAFVEKDNAYVIRSPFSGNEFFVLEYRTMEEAFDRNIPGNGLIVYRIDSRFEGNGYYNEKEARYDEVFVAKNNDKANKKFYKTGSDPVTLKLRDGTSTGITLSNFVIAGDQMSFTVSFNPDVKLQGIFGNIKDYRVAQAILDEVNEAYDSEITMDKVTEADLLEITELTLYSGGYYYLSVDLEGIQCLANLKKLVAIECKIDDISYLGGLTKLTQLYLYDNNIIDIKPLENLTALKTLKLRGNLITDYSPVKDYYDQLIVKDFSLSNANDVIFKISDYNDAGWNKKLKINLSSTIPWRIFMKIEQYNGSGLLEKSEEIGNEQYLSSKESINYELPDGVDYEKGYVISAFERRDFKQLCSKLIVAPVKFSF